jgi:hypothetical protein
MVWSPDYITTAELKAFREIELDDTVDDVQIGLAITAASRAVDRFCGRQFGSAEQDRYYVASRDPSHYYHQWYADIDDIQTTDGLVVSVDTDGSGAYSDVLTDSILAPLNAEADGKPWTKIALSRSGNVKVHATFGWTDVPASVKQATLLQASRILMRRDAVFGIAGSGDSQLRLLDRVDPDVASVLRPYRRVWGAA